MERLKRIIRKNRNIINNIVGACIVRGGALIISLITIPAYMNYFHNKTVLGLWFTVLSVLNWVLMFDLGLGNGLRNKLPFALVEGDKNKVKKYISSTYISMFMMITILSIISFLVFPYIPWNHFFNIDNNLISHDTLVRSIKIIFIGILIQFLLKLITSILYAIQKSAIVNLLGLLSNIVILIYISYAPTKSLEESLITMAWLNVVAANLPLLLATIIIFSTILKGCKPSFKEYDNMYAMEIFKIGGVLLWLQVVFMVISSTNEFLISRITNPSYVVEYQVYNKIFNTGSSLLVLGLLPMWSAVTKAQAEKDYSWIKKLSKILYMMTFLAFIVEISIIPFLNQIISIWLGGSAIDVKVGYGIIFAISNSIFILHNVNTTLGNGMSYFKIQVIWMTFAAVVNIPLSYLFVGITGKWIGVILANILSLLPFEILQPIYFRRYINRLNTEKKQKEIQQRIIPVISKESFVTETPN